MQLSHRKRIVSTDLMEISSENNGLGSTMTRFFSFFYLFHRKSWTPWSLTFTSVKSAASITAIMTSQKMNTEGKWLSSTLLPGHHWSCKLHRRAIHWWWWMAKETIPQAITPNRTKQEGGDSCYATTKTLKILISSATRNNPIEIQTKQFRKQSFSEKTTR